MWAWSAVGGFFSIICKTFKTLDFDFFLFCSNLLIPFPVKCVKSVPGYFAELLHESMKVITLFLLIQSFNLRYNTSFVLQSLLFQTNSIWCIYQFINYHIKSMHMWLIDYQRVKVLLPNSIRHLKWICSAYFIIRVTLHKFKIILSYLTPFGLSWLSQFVLAGFRAHMWLCRSPEIPWSLNSFPETLWKNCFESFSCCTSAHAEFFISSFQYKVWWGCGNLIAGVQHNQHVDHKPLTQPLSSSSDHLF